MTRGCWSADLTWISFKAVYSLIPSPIFLSSWSPILYSILTKKNVCVSLGIWLERQFCEAQNCEIAGVLFPPISIRAKHVCEDFWNIASIQESNQPAAVLSSFWLPLFSFFFYFLSHFLSSILSFIPSLISEVPTILLSSPNVHCGIVLFSGLLDTLRQGISYLPSLLSLPCSLLSQGSAKEACSIMQ